MAEQTSQTNNHAATLAAALSNRIEVLATAARDTLSAIEQDRSVLGDRYGSSAMADELVDAVRGRIDGVAGDCRDLSAILDRFKSLAGPPQGVEPDFALPDPLPISPVGRGISVDPADGAYLSDGVRLLATQMSVSGARPEEIATRLREDFGVTESDRLVRELFGLPSDDDREDSYDSPVVDDTRSHESEGPPG